MHPDLRLSNLDSLPIMKRRLAKSIMAGPITKQTLAEFATVQLSRPTTPTSAFTPLFYFLLDPTRMPPISALDALDANTLSDLSGGFLALTCIVDARPSRQTFPDLWPRISSWSYYIFQHEEFLVKVLGLSSLKEYYLRMMKFLDHMSKLPANQAIIVSARTSHVLAARAWSYYSDQAVFSTHPGALLTISDILVQGVVRLDDIFEGLRGDVSDLAYLIARQSELAVPPEASSMDMDKFCYLVMTLSVVSQIDDISNSGPSHRHVVCSALLPQGFVRTLTVAGLTLSDISPAEFSKEYSIAIGLLLCVLQVVLEQDRGSQSVQTAVRCGLLRTLLAVSTWSHFDEAVVHYIHLILANILGPFTVYYHVLEELEKADALDIVDQAARLRLHPKLVEGWRTFGSAVRARLELRDSFHLDPAQCRNVCGSCGIILAKNLLRRCSRCRWEMYCSTNCQARDWRSGHHRFYCAMDHISRISMSFSFSATPLWPSSFIHSLRSPNDLHPQGVHLPPLPRPPRIHYRQIRHRPRTCSPLEGEARHLGVHGLRFQVLPSQGEYKGHCCGGVSAWRMGICGPGDEDEDGCGAAYVEGCGGAGESLGVSAGEGE
ncbi:hypothetical protein R3P38DRAFT_2878416 [Favolaschia claudopus]|uniref:MYND-type domain-containing protein n=1 Tax=Favolaschia claudopus TaxID=2862362 RepID=A0AAW0CZ54_9AGAR